MDYGVGAGGGRCGSAALQWESIRKREWASAETTQILPVRGAAVQLFAGDRGELPLPVRHLPADAGTGAGVPSRFVRKIICRLRRNEVSRQWRRRSKPRPRSHWKKLTQLALSSFMPSAAPKTSRKPSSFSCTIFSDIVCCLLSNVCVVTSFCQSLQAMSSFMHFPICAAYCSLSGQNIRLN